MGSGQKPVTHLIQIIRPYIMGGLLDALYDEKEGTVLGRDAKSWAKILSFYAVYYTFLGILFYGFTISFYMGSYTNPVGEKPSVKNSRLDQPGAAVHPFKELDNDGALNKFHIFFNGKKNLKDNGLQATTYCQTLAEYYEGKIKLNANAQDCSAADVTTSDATCKVDANLKNVDAEFLGKPMNAATCESFMKAKKPMFAIDINKIVDWTPSVEGIGFDCYEYDFKNQTRLTTQSFNFIWTSESSRIAAHYFPFHGLSKEQPIIQSSDALQKKLDCSTAQCEANKPYNKGFVGGYIEAKDPKTVDFAPGGNMFRCDVQNTKINGLKGLTKDAQADLRKLGLGFVEFGFKF